MFAGLSSSDEIKRASVQLDEQIGSGSRLELTTGSDEDGLSWGTERVGHNDEHEDERRLDEILDRLHKSGKENISEEDQAFLDRVSQRFRRRREG